MLTADFDFDLPAELIASEPLADRAGSRMMVVHRDTGVIEHRQFCELPQFIQAGDLLVLNDTRVDRARFFSDDGRREVLRTEKISALQWRCMVRPGRKFRVGDTVHMAGTVGKVTAFLDSGERIIQWEQEIDDERYGHLPLPHYMQRGDNEADRERYQTVFAAKPGSIAAPTAGLHFTPTLLAQLPHAFVTLQVGAGTFLPVKTEQVQEHRMHTERYELSAETVTTINAAQRVMAVGTTACRTLETVATRHGALVANAGETDIFIYPGYQFKVVQALLTNFHLPKSSLIMLVSAFAGRELILAAYAQAVQERYRFYSYGDCMLIL